MGALQFTMKRSDFTAGKWDMCLTIPTPALSGSGIRVFEFTSQISAYIGTPWLLFAKLYLIV